jgi:hypothetical protein
MAGNPVIVNHGLSMFWRPGFGSAKGHAGKRGRAMSREPVERIVALAVGFAIVGCWSMTSSMVVSLALGMFTVPVG